MTEIRVWVSLFGEDVVAGTLYNHRRRGVESTTFITTVSTWIVHGPMRWIPSFHW